MPQRVSPPPRVLWWERRLVRARVELALGPLVLGSGRALRLWWRRLVGVDTDDEASSSDDSPRDGADDARRAPR